MWCFLVNNTIIKPNFERGNPPFAEANVVLFLTCGACGKQRFMHRFSIFMPVKIVLMTMGRTGEAYLLEGIKTYQDRLKRYLDITIHELPALKNAANLPEAVQKEKEGGLLLGSLNEGDVLVLLDERGKEFDSPGFAKFMQQQMNNSVKRLVFVVGGPYGFSEEVKKRANGKVSLSKMTFSHQMVRLFFMEQLYRAMTILKGERYHHS
jgi:23S rRNA (pseudouridine1915-N3)-methyltransferase